MTRTLPILLSLLLASSGSLPAALVSPASETFATKILPAAGVYYRPGEWILLHVDADLPPSTTGSFVPELLLQTEDDRESFVSQLAPLSLTGGGMRRFSFWAMAGRSPPVVQLVLKPTQGGPAMFGARHSRALTPLGAEIRLVLAFSRSLPVIRRTRFAAVRADLLPEHPALYESCDLMILGQITGSDSPQVLARSQINAIGEWIARGGIVLVLDAQISQDLVRSLTRRGWPPAPWTPFLLRTPFRDSERLTPPLARRAGRGLIVSLNPEAPYHMRIMAGKAVWEKLNREFLPVSTEDVRLAPGRHRALGREWPGRPSLGSGPALRWCAAWAIAVFAVFLVPAVRCCPWRMTTGLCGISILMALGFCYRQPVMPLNLMRFQVRVAGETGRLGPSLDEELLVVVPFDQRQPVEIEFSQLPPPRIQVQHRSELQRRSLLLPGRLRIAPRLSGAASARQPMLFSCRRSGDPLQPLSAVCREERDGLSLGPNSGLPLQLHGVVLQTEEGRIRVERYDGQSVSITPFSADWRSPSARDRVRQMLQAEHSPGRYATLMGWEGPAVEEKSGDLGAIHIHTLHVLREK